MGKGETDRAARRFVAHAKRDLQHQVDDGDRFSDCGDDDRFRGNSCGNRICIEQPVDF
jgi:hypothetical protein